MYTVSFCLYWVHESPSWECHDALFDRLSGDRTSIKQLLAMSVPWQPSFIFPSNRRRSNFVNGKQFNIQGSFTPKWASQKGETESSLRNSLSSKHLKSKVCLHLLASNSESTNFSNFWQFFKPFSHTFGFHLHILIDLSFYLFLTCKIDRYWAKSITGAVAHKSSQLHACSAGM